MTDHPITPPPELVQQWIQEATGPNYEEVIATRAAQYGADQELEACCKWLDPKVPGYITCDLRAARRPKPPSLKELAFSALDTYIYGNPDHGDKQNTYNTIRRALEQLPE